MEDYSFGRYTSIMERLSQRYYDKALAPFGDRGRAVFFSVMDSRKPGYERS